MESNSSQDICEKCGKTRSKVASITQWISFGDKCSCDRNTAEPSFKLETSEVQVPRSESCPRCGGSLSKQSGSLTQWVFRSAPCRCGNTTNDAIVAPPVAPLMEVIPFEEESGIEVDPQRFPLKRYIPLELIGSGQQGDVYRAGDRLLARLVCIKILKTPKLLPEVVVRFQREAQAGGKLTHPAITTVLDFGMTEQGQPFLVMEFSSGEPLSDLVKTRGALPLELTLKLFHQICEGMQHAHQNRVLHRDLKSSNVLVTNIDGIDPSVKIIDFGLSGLLDTVDDTGMVTQQGLLMGTPAYMSPEQVKQLALDERSDLYSVCCMLFETLTGQPVFVGENALAVMNMQLEDAPPALAEIAPDIDFPEKLELILQKGLEKDPDDRFQTMAELNQSLQNLHASSDSHNVEPEPVQAERRPLDLSRFAPLGFALIAIGVLWLSASIILSQSEFERAATPKKDVYEVVHWGTQAWTLAIGDFHGHSNSQKLYRNCKGTYGIKIIDPNFSDSDLPVVLRLNPKALDLSRTSITNAGVKTVASMNELNCLVINENKNITDAALESLKKIPELKIVSLRGTSVTDAGVSTLAQIPALASIDLSDLKGVGRESLISLSTLPNLYALRISGSGIKGEDLPLLKNIKCLSAIALANLDLTDSDMVTVDELNAISVDVSQNPRITIAGLKLLKPERYWTFEYKGCSLSEEDVRTIITARDNQPITVEAIELTKHMNDEVLPEGVNFEVYALWYNPTVANAGFVKDLYRSLRRNPKF